MQHTDQRLKLINEVLVGALTMKMYCWEEALLKSVRISRKLEMKYIERAAMIRAFNMGLYFSAHPLVAAIIFFPYFYSVGKLEPSVVFPVLTFFQVFKLGPLTYYIF